MTRRMLAFALCTTALTIAGAARADTTRDRMPQIYTMTPMGVNLQSGTFVHSETDFTIGSLSFVRGWRSTPSAQVGGGTGLDHHLFGGWNHNYGFAAHRHPTVSDGIEIYADGKVYQFRLTGGTSWTPWNIDQHNNNSLGTLLTGSPDSNLVFRNRNGDVYTFNADNQASNVVYADGTRLDLLYDASKRLHTVLSNRGDAIVLDYGANGRIERACGFNRAELFVQAATTCASATPPVGASYGYAATGLMYQPWKLASVTGADNQVTQMTYDNYYRLNLLCITLPGSGTCRITNEYGPTAQNSNYLPDQVNRQTTATGEVWRYEYSDMTQYGDWLPLQPGEPPRLTSATMYDPLYDPDDPNDPNDPVHAATVVEYENGFLKRLTAPEGTTEYGWGGLNPVRFTAPGQNVEILSYDLRSNLFERTRQPAPNSGDSDIVTRATYPASVPSVFPTGCNAASQRLCNKPITTTDERNNVTGYTYDPAHGGVLTVTRPAVPVRQGGNIVNVQPQTRYTYQLIAAGVRNGANLIEAAPTSVWVLTEESECRTTASCTGQPDEVRTIYEYGQSGSANALRMRGRTVTGNGVTARSCFTYDAVGNRISETGPGGTPALGTACPG